jgi:uncharacterized protein
VKAALFTLAWLLAGVIAMAQVPVPRLEARVTDLTGTLTAEQQASLEQKLAAFEARKGAQVAVLIVPTTQPEDIAQYGVRLMESWKLGRKGVDDGAALIVAKDDRALRIEVQYGLEGVLTDAVANRIVEDTIVPLFRKGNFAGGVTAGIDQILRVIEGEPLPAPAQRNGRGAPGIPWPVLIFGALFLAGFLRPMVGRGPAAGIIGAGSGGLVYWLGSRVLEAVGAGIGVFLLTLLFGFGGGYGGQSIGRGGRVFRDSGRGGFGGGFGGGGGGGGWSGGGGMGGGGGASGRW